jgi:hypothetical protein
MKIGEAYNILCTDLYLGNICNAISTFFKNITGSSGSKQVSEAGGNAGSVSPTSTSLTSVVAADQRKFETSKTAKAPGTVPERNDVDNPQAPGALGENDIDDQKAVAWDKSYNEEVDALESKAITKVKEFLEGKTPSVLSIEDMSLETARQLLGIENEEKTNYLSIEGREGILIKALDTAVTQLRNENNPNGNDSLKKQRIRAQITQAVVVMKTAIRESKVQYNLIPDPRSSPDPIWGS